MYARPCSRSRGTKIRRNSCHCGAYPRHGQPVPFFRHSPARALVPASLPVFSGGPDSHFPPVNSSSQVAPLPFLFSPAQVPACLLSFPYRSHHPTSQPHLRSPAGRLRMRTPARRATPRCLRGAFLRATGYARLLHIRAFPALDYISHRLPGRFRTLISGSASKFS